MKKFQRFTITLICCMGFSSSAIAGLMSTDYEITASVGNPIVSSDFPLSGSTVVSAGSEFNQSASLVFTAGDFNQTFSGNVGFDLTEDTITVSFSGTAQGVGLLFNFSNMVWDVPSIITDIILVSQSCAAQQFSCNGVASFATPSSTGNSVSGMGITMFGFQSGLNFSQTYRLVTADDPNTPPPPPPTNIPEPSTLFLLSLALLGLRVQKKA